MYFKQEFSGQVCAAIQFLGSVNDIKHPNKHMCPLDVSILSSNVVVGTLGLLQRIKFFRKKNNTKSPCCMRLEKCAHSLKASSLQWRKRQQAKIKRVPPRIIRHRKPIPIRRTPSTPVPVCRNQSDYAPRRVGLWAITRGMGPSSLYSH
eukprot:scaffold6750_cov160-Amphora_coffeaeformis.AAC.14